MSISQDQKQEWHIDRVLDRFTGRNVRVLGRSFLPVVHDSGREMSAFIRTDDLYLPDNRKPDGFPVFFEGRLDWFERRIGVVFVGLNSSDHLDSAPDGFVPFRGKLAVIVRAPAVVELDFPFFAELLPDAGNYWKDLHYPSAQFELPLDK